MARNIKDLHPRLQEAVEKLKEKFPDIGIGECVRTVAEQDALYAKGRTKPGKKVTNAKGSTYSSQHQWGIAVDFFYNKKGEEFSDRDYFRKVGAYAKSIGLGWGGDWKNPVDMPHLYLPDWGKTPSKLKSKYGTPDKFRETWEGGDAADQTSDKPSKPNTSVQQAKVSVDGMWGPSTTKALQQIFGTPADGTVSNQYDAYRIKNPGLLSSSWKWEKAPGKSGSPLVKALQKKVGVKPDGFIGPKTIKAIQKWLGSGSDGCFSKPSPCIKKLQQWINKQ